MRSILALWAVPRSTSTAFEWMMRMRGDHRCFHEPFGEVWYQGEDPDWPRVQADSVRTPGLTYESVWDRLRIAAAEEAVFIKDFPHYIVSLSTDDFLANFTHSFLIRDPAKTVTSMYAHWPDFHVAETGFAEQRALFDRIVDQGAPAPPVLDSDDLLAAPDVMVDLWCRAVGIPFLPESLTWEPGPRDEVSLWDGGSFHRNLRNSTGLAAQPRPPVDLAGLPTRVRRVIDELSPHYEHLRRHRLRRP